MSLAFRTRFRPLLVHATHIGNKTYSKTPTRLVAPAIAVRNYSGRDRGRLVKTERTFSRRLHTLDASLRAIATSSRLSDEAKMRHAIRVGTHRDMVEAERDMFRTFCALAREGLQDDVEIVVKQARRFQLVMKRVEDARWEAWGYSVFAPWGEVGLLERCSWVSGVVVFNIVGGPLMRGPMRFFVWWTRKVEEVQRRCRGGAEEDGKEAAAKDLLC